MAFWAEPRYSILVGITGWSMFWPVGMGSEGRLAGQLDRRSL